MLIVLWFSVVLLSAAYVCGRIVDPDLWWHITAGRWILANWQVPTQDHWSMFGLGKPWVAYSWSNELLFAAVDGAFPEHGLIVLKLLLSLLITFSFSFCFSKISKDWFVGLFLGVYVSMACYSHFTLRPQSFVWVFFVWLLYFCNRILNEGFSRKSAIWVFMLMSFWANTHLSSILGIFAIVAWLLPMQGLSLENAREKLTPLFKTVLVALAGTLCTPYLGREWLVFFKKSGHPLEFSNIVEFGSANIAQYSTVFLVLLIVLAVVLLARAPQLLNRAQIIGWGVYLIGALAVVKFLPFADIFGACLLASVWGRASGKQEVLGNLAGAILELRKLCTGFSVEVCRGLSFVACCAAFVLFYHLWLAPLELGYVPKLALDFIEKHNLPHPILNSFGQGGYVMYRFSDKQGNLKYPVAIDGRTNVTPADVFRKHTATLNGKRNWRQFIEMVNPETILWRLDSPLISILEAEGKWCIVYGNLGAERGDVVLVKREYFESKAGELSSSNCKMPAA